MLTGWAGFSTSTVNLVRCASPFPLLRLFSTLSLKRSRPPCYRPAFFFETCLPTGLSGAPFLPEGDLPHLPEASIAWRGCD